MRTRQIVWYNYGRPRIHRMPWSRKENQDLNKKNIRRRNIVIACALLTGILIVLMFLLFRKEIAEKKRQREIDKVEWNTDKLGSIQTSAEDPSVTEPPQEKTISDSLGNVYKEFTFKNLGYSIFLPATWKTYGDNFTLKSIDPKKESDTYQVEISVIPLFKHSVSEGEGLPSLWAIRNESGSNIQYSYKYRAYDKVFQASSFIIEESNEPKNKILYQPIDIKMKTAQNVQFDPYTACYYKYIGTRGFCIIVTGHESLEVSVETIAKTVAENFNEIKKEEEKVTPVVLNKAETIKGLPRCITYSVNNSWKPVKVLPGSISTLPETKAYRITDDVTKPEYGLELTVMKVPKSDLDLRSYDEYTDYAHSIFFNDEPDMLTAMHDDGTRIEYTVYDEKDKTASGTVSGRWYDYQKYYYYSPKHTRMKAFEMSNDMDGNLCYICHSADRGYDVIFNINYSDKNFKTASQILERVIGTATLEE